jgi:acylphosphatase
MISQARAVFSGKVQGVGFRYTAREIAGELGLAGWVRNLADGSVEIVAEGERELVQQFLERLSVAFARNVRETQVEWGQATEGARGFEIRR